MTQLCPCNSQLSYQDCCQKVHLSHCAARKPEQLMRARFSAHVLGLLDFIIQTYHPSCQAEQQREAIADSLRLSWNKLEVLFSEIDKTDPKLGYVEFNAFYTENGRQQCLSERSRFVQENQNGQEHWYYLDGTYSEKEKQVKIGRNDPCPCQSGKKYKKCCG